MSRVAAAARPDASAEVAPAPGGNAAPPGTAPPAPGRPRVLVVDDESSMREMLRIVLRREGWDVILAENGRAAVARLRGDPVDVLLSDIRMPDLNGMEVLRVAREANPEIIAFMMTAYASTDTAVEAMRLGAVDYFTKPFSMDELRLKVRQHLEAGRLRRENVLLKRTLGSRHGLSNIIGRSEPMLAVFRMVESIAPTGSTVLITGESGTGKDLVARAIHEQSLRREHPFVAVNCGGVPETLLESELFGHVRGAFTGAETSKKGLMEVAERGTIFLDEIGEMSVTMQVKLLRVLQDRRFRRLGGTEEVQADIRIVAATNQDLPARVAEGAFREDLYYRINVIPIHLPPLRERRDDIPLLAAHFLEKCAAQMQKPVRGLAGETLERLTAYDWPGNIRELENAIERAVALEQTPVVLPESLPAHIRERRGAGAGRPVPPGRGDVPDAPLERRHSAHAAAPADAPLVLPDGFDLEAHGEELYRRYMMLALERAGGVQVKAAEMLGMSFRSFRYYAKKFQLR